MKQNKKHILMTEEQMKAQDDKRVITLAKLKDGSFIKTLNIFPYLGTIIDEKEYDELVKISTHLKLSDAHEGQMLEFYSE